MRNGIRCLALVMAMAVTATGVSADSPPPKTVKVALQAGSTAAWEVAAMHALMLDEENSVELKVRKMDSETAQAALQAGKVDVILSDFAWVSRQRNQGADVTFVPYSLAAGGLMARPGSKVNSVGDLKGATLAVAGGPTDPDYLVLVAYYAAKTGGDLTKDATVDFAAPSVVDEKLAGGQADATLNDWDFDARAAASGVKQIVSIPDMLTDLGLPQRPPVLGWVFSEKWAADKPDVANNLITASFATQQALLTDDALWDKIRPKMGADDDAQFIALRDAYRAGIVVGFSDADIGAARQTYAILAQYGGADVTGGKPDLAEGTFWKGYRQ